MPASCNKAACGAADSFGAAPKLVEWRAPSYAAVVAGGCTALNLAVEAPRTTSRYLRAGWEAMSASRAIHPLSTAEAQKHMAARSLSTSEDISSVLEVIGGKLAPWFQPFAAMAHSRWTRRQAGNAVASTASLVESKWWTPKRFYEQEAGIPPFC